MNTYTGGSAVQSGQRIPDKVKVMLETVCTWHLKATVVTVKHADGSVEKVAATGVVYGGRYEAALRRGKEFSRIMPMNVVTIGDAKKPGTIFNATTTAF
jgi:hypothetical protein